MLPISVKNGRPESMQGKRYRIICTKHQAPVTTFADEPVCQECGRPVDVVIPKLEERKGK